MDYLRSQYNEIDRAEERIRLYKSLSRRGIVVCDIQLSKELEARRFTLSREKSTPEALKIILESFSSNKRRILPFNDGDRKVRITIHVSDVKGIYMNVYTSFGEFEFQLANKESSFLRNKIYKCLKVEKSNNWKEAKCNVLPNVGDWGVEEYQEGYMMFYPRKDYHPGTMVNYLKPLLYE